MHTPGECDHIKSLQFPLEKGIFSCIRQVILAGKIHGAQSHTTRHDGLRYRQNS